MCMGVEDIDQPWISFKLGKCPHIFETGPLPGTWDLLFKLGCLVIESRRFSCLLLPSAGIKYMSPYIFGY